MMFQNWNNFCIVRRVATHGNSPIWDRSRVLQLRAGGPKHGRGTEAQKSKGEDRGQAPINFHLQGRRYENYEEH
jgi:hypothetical protein